MKVLLIGVPGFNRGDDAIAVGMAGIIRSALPGVELTISAVRTLTTRMDGRVIVIDRKSLRGHIKLIFAISRSDLVVIGGGSIIQDEISSSWLRGIMSFFAEVVSIAAILRRPVITAPIGVDTLRSQRGIRIASYILGKTDEIWTREAISAVRAKALTGGRTIGVAADPAVLFRRGQRLRGPRLETLILCPAFEDRTRMITTELFAKICNDFLSTSPDSRVVFVAMDERSHEDGGAKESLLSHIRKEWHRRVTFEVPLDLETCIDFLTAGSCLVTMRLHPIILVADLIPVLCLSRGAKMDAIAPELGVERIALVEPAVDEVALKVAGFVANMSQGSARENYLSNCSRMRCDYKASLKEYEETLRVRFSCMSS